MSVIAPDLRSAIESAPHQTFRAIIRTLDPAVGYVAEVESAGLTVHHVYRLVPGIAVSGRGSALLRLADLPWVHAIEADKEMRAL